MYKKFVKTEKCETILWFQINTKHQFKFNSKTCDENVMSYLFSQNEEEMSNFCALSQTPPSTFSNNSSSITNNWMINGSIETEENEESQSEELENSEINEVVNNSNHKSSFSVGKKRIIKKKSCMN